MNRLVRMDAADLQSFIQERVESHAAFKNLLAVTLDRYPSEFAATIWMAEEPNREMRKFAYDLEAELEALGIDCTIIVKTDRQLSLPDTYRLRTSKGEFTYRSFKVDSVKDEDMVFVFSMHRGPDTYRFRAALTGTLASMLRARNRLREDTVLEVYLDAIRSRIEGDAAGQQETNHIVFNSKHIALFTGK